MHRSTVSYLEYSIIFFFIISMSLLVKLGLFDFRFNDTPIIPLWFGYFWWILSSILGLICAMMAQSRGRKVILGFFSGYLFGIISVIYYLLAGDILELRIQKEEAVKRSMGR